MASYEMVAWLVLSLVGPVVFGLITLAIMSNAEKSVVLTYAIGMIVLLAAVVVSVGFNLYVASVHRSWWDNGPMWWFDVIAGVIVVIIAICATEIVLPDSPSTPEDE